MPAEDRRDPFLVWCETLSCRDPDWQAVHDALPVPDEFGPDVAVVAAAWRSWRGRERWLREHPQVWP